MRFGGVSHDVDDVAAVLQLAELVEREKRRAGEVGFHAQHAIQFNRMADGLVDLQAKLR